MKGSSKIQVLTFPTPTLAALFPTLCGELQQIRDLLGPLRTALVEPEGGYSHRQCLQQLDELFDEASPALALFLAYPTKRLAASLTRAIADATAAVAWLAQHPPEAAEHLLAVEYCACCERMQGGFRDWRLSVELEAASRDLDLRVDETLH